MKVVAPAEMARIEALAYEAGFLESDFMEAAGRGIAKRIQEFIHEHKRAQEIMLLCGHGNNGGDAYVAGRYLLEKGFVV